MKILYVVPNPPSLVRVRPYNLIRHLMAHGHQITVATVWRGEQERADLEEIRRAGAEVLAVPLATGQILRNMVGALTGGLPAQATYCETPALHRAIQAEVFGRAARGRPYDIVHVEHLRGARYGLRLQRQLAAHGAHLPVVWDSVDCISHLFGQAARHSRSLKGRWMARAELQRTRRYEGYLVGRFAHTLVTSPVDRQALCRLYPDRAARPRIRVLPNGVDLAYFTPDDTPREPATVLFSGKMSYHANVSAAQHLVQTLMPAVWQERPEVRVVLAGKDPPASLRRLPERYPNVEVTGTVPDLRPYLRRATVAVSPLLYGAGIQNKVLEAMACATPVIASPSAAGALRIRPGEELLVAEDGEHFARQLVGLLASPDQQRRLSATGLAYVHRHHDWMCIAADLARLYRFHATPVSELSESLLESTG